MTHFDRAPTLMSVGVAGFGATAYAGAIAIKLGDRQN